MIGCRRVVERRANTNLLLLRLMLYSHVGCGNRRTQLLHGRPWSHYKPCSSQLMFCPKHSFFFSASIIHFFLIIIIIFSLLNSPPHRV